MASLPPLMPLVASLFHCIQISIMSPFSCSIFAILIVIHPPNYTDLLGYFHPPKPCFGIWRFHPSNLASLSTSITFHHSHSIQSRHPTPCSSCLGGERGSWKHIPPKISNMPRYYWEGGWKFPWCQGIIGRVENLQHAKALLGGWKFPTCQGTSYWERVENLQHAKAWEGGNFQHAKALL